MKYRRIIILALREFGIFVRFHTPLCAALLMLCAATVVVTCETFTQAYAAFDMPITTADRFIACLAPQQGSSPILLTCGTTLVCTWTMLIDQEDRRTSRLLLLGGMKRLYVLLLCKATIVAFTLGSAIVATLMVYGIASNAEFINFSKSESLFFLFTAGRTCDVGTMQALGIFVACIYTSLLYFSWMFLLVSAFSRVPWAAFLTVLVIAFGAYPGHETFSYAAFVNMSYLSFLSGEHGLAALAAATLVIGAIGLIHAGRTEVFHATRPNFS